MRNLGSFAGGLTDGFATGARLVEMRNASRRADADVELRKAASSRADREVKIREDEFAFLQSERQRAADLRKSWESYNTDFWAPREVEEEVQVSDGAGGFSKAIQKRTVKRDPKSAADQLAHLNGAFQLMMSHTPDIQSLQKMHELGKEMRKTEMGEMIFGAMRGDPAALQGLATHFKVDPKDVKLDFNAEGGPKIDVKGQQHDFLTYMQIASGHDTFEALAKQQARAQDAAKHKAEVARIGAQTRQAEASADASRSSARQNDYETAHVLPAQVGALRASASESSARAGLANEQKIAGRAGDALEKVLGRIPDPTHIDGKTDWTGHTSWAAARLLRTPLAQREQMVAKIAEDYGHARRATAELMAQLQADKPRLKRAMQQFGTTDPRVLHLRILEANLHSLDEKK